LLPLAGTPIIEYTLEFLAANGVEEIFIYMVSNSDGEHCRQILERELGVVERGCFGQGQFANRM